NTFTANSNIVNKEYRGDGTHNFPYSSFQIAQLGGGQWQVSISIPGPSQVVINVTSYPYLLSSNQWYLLSLTFDGTNLKAYINGMLAGTTTI
ncbi:LamG-like jellyroll fold domain-containing protein, partial [Acinetobacter baumannii]